MNLMNDEIWDKTILSLGQIDSIESDRYLQIASDKSHSSVTDFWEQPLETIQSLYTATFDIGIPQPPCPPYSGLYLPDSEVYPGPRTDLMSELQSLYMNWGLELEDELPDHIAIELEFMHFLFVSKNAAEESNDFETLERLYKDHKWLNSHLISCLPLFCQILHQKCKTRFWIHAGDLLDTINRYREL